MIYFLFVCLLLKAMVSGQETRNGTGQGQEEQSTVLEQLIELSDQAIYTTQSSLNDTTSGKVVNSRKPTQLSKRDVNNLSFWCLRLKHTCAVNSRILTENYVAIETATRRLYQCSEWRGRKYEDLYEYLCRRISQQNSCFDDYIDSLRKYLPRFKEWFDPSLSNSHNDVKNFCCNFMDYSDRASEDNFSFVQSIKVCGANFDDACLDFDDPKHDRSEHSETSLHLCRKLIGFRNCVKSGLQECSPALISALESVGKALTRFYRELCTFHYIFA